MNKKNEISDILSHWRDFKNGKTKLRTWKIVPETHKRTKKLKSIDDLRNERSVELKKLRKNALRMTQTELAKAIHVSTRTLQGWEIGKSLPPEPVMILIRLMTEMPSVRSRLAA